MSTNGVVMIAEAVHRVVMVLKNDAFTEEEMLKLKKIIGTLGRITEKTLADGLDGDIDKELPKPIKSEDKFLKAKNRIKGTEEKKGNIRVELGFEMSPKPTAQGGGEEEGAVDNEDGWYCAGCEKWMSENAEGCVRNERHFCSAECADEYEA